MPGLNCSHDQVFCFAFTLVSLLGFLVEHPLVSCLLLGLRLALGSPVLVWSPTSVHGLQPSVESWEGKRGIGELSLVCFSNANLGTVPGSDGEPFRTLNGNKQPAIAHVPWGCHHWSLVPEAIFSLCLVLFYVISWMRTRNTLVPFQMTQMRERESSQRIILRSSSS